MTKTLVKGAWYTVTTASTCSVTDANGTTLGTAEAGKQFTFQATTEQISFSDDSATVLVNPNHAPVAASSHGTGGEELKIELLGEEFEDALQLGDPTVESITHSDYRQSMALCPGFEEPVSMAGVVTALRVPRAVQRMSEFDGAEGIVNYCILSSYDADGSLIGTTRGDFTVTVQDIYVEFEEPLDVITGGKIKFEFGFRNSMSDYGVGYGAPCFDCYYVTNGKVAKKEGARLLESAGLNPVFSSYYLPEIVGYTLFRTIYYKTLGAVDEKIAVHEDDTTAHLTATEHAGLNQLLAEKAVPRAKMFVNEYISGENNFLNEGETFVEDEAKVLVFVQPRVVLVFLKVEPTEEVWANVLAELTTNYTYNDAGVSFSSYTL